MRIPRIFTTGLAGLLVCLLIVIPSSPAAADPDKIFGEKQTWESELWSAGPLQLGVDCHGSAWWVAKRAAGVVTYSMKLVASTCTIARPGNPPNSGDTHTLQVTGENDAGQCNPSSTTSIARFGGGLFTGQWEEVSNEIQLGFADDPSDSITPPLPGLGGVCVPRFVRGEGWKAEINLGEMPSFGTTTPDSHSGSTCPAGTPTEVSRVLEPHPTSGVSSRYVYTIKWRSPGATGVWGQATQGKPGWTIGQSRTITGPDFVTSTLTGQTSYSFTSAYFLDSDPITVEANKIGFQLYHTATQPYTTSSAPGYTSPSQFRWGTTDPGKCLFWFGPQAFTDPSTDREVPWSPAYSTVIGSETEPEPDPGVEDPGSDPAAPDEACNFDVLDPGSWLEGGMCAVVGLLGKIVTTLVGIFNALIALPAALLDAIGALFVPDQAVLEATGSSMKDAWAESSVGTFAEDFAAVPQAFNPSSGGCAGPSIPINQAGVDIDWKPLNSCSGTGATVAGIARAMITLSLIIGTAYAVLRLIGSALGLNLNGIGGKGD